MASRLRSLAIRSLEGWTRLRGGGGRLLVLIYHRVLPARDPMYPYDPDAGAFRQQMTTLREDFRVLRLGDALEALAGQRLPERAVAVTFDDGFADNCECALPVLRDLGLPATFFVASGYLGNGCMFNDAVIEACRGAPAGTWDTGTPQIGAVEVTGDRAALAYGIIRRIKYLPGPERMDCARRLLDAARAAVPPGIMMSHEQLRRLHAAGMEIGGHTRSHPILAALGDAEAAREIEAGKSDLEAVIGERVRLFAYPNGQPGRDYRARDVALVQRAGFSAAVTTAWGFADRESGPYEIPRVGSWGGDAWRFSGRLALARGGSRGESCGGNPVAGTA